MRNYLKVFINTFSENSIESLYSRRLKYIMESKTHLIDINFTDINMEIAKAYKADQKFDSIANLRSKLFYEHGLIKNGKDNEIILP